MRPAPMDIATRKHFGQHALDQFPVDLFREQGIDMLVPDSRIGTKEMQVFPIFNPRL